MPTYKSGSSQSGLGTFAGSLLDDSGNTLISSGQDFGVSPLSEILLSQIRFGVANGQFNEPNADQSSYIGYGNQVPYWFWDDQCQTAQAIKGSLSYDETAQTYGVVINPLGAIVGDYINFSTRVPVITDTNANLRQKLLASLSKSSSYSGTSQWALTATMNYYDHTDTVVSSYVVGTAAHNASWTSISGYTTSGGTAIPTTASYCDVVFTLTPTATVTDTTTVTIQSCLLQDSISGSGSFVITQTFTSSTAWTPPTGVNLLLGVLVVGGGGGGASSSLNWQSSTTTLSGAGGGASGALSYVRNLNINAGSAITIGIGAGGAGGSAPTTYVKPANTAQTNGSASGNVGGAGGATTFGSFITAGGGGGGLVSQTPGTAASTPTTALDGATILSSAGGSGAVTAGGPSAGSPGSNTAFYAYYPLIATTYAGQSGSAGTVSSTPLGTNVLYPGVAGAAGSAGFCGSGGGAGNVGREQTIVGGAGGNGGGGGAGAENNMRGASSSYSGTVVITGGAGGNGGQNSGGGGGASGGASQYGLFSSSGNTSSVTITGAKGGDGGAGYVVVSYVS